MSAPSQKDRHDRVCRMLGFALTLGPDAEAWGGLSTVLRCRLNPLERACVLASVIGSMAFEDVLFIVETVHSKEQSGMPLPSLGDPVDDATWWAGHASLEERKAILVAALVSLPERDRQTFLAQATRRMAA